LSPEPKAPPPVHKVYEAGGDCAAAPDCEYRLQEQRLRVGAAVAAEAREEVRTHVGLRCSAGIATNKLCAKLVSGLHKPDDQTLLLPSEARATVAPLPVSVGFSVYGSGFRVQGSGYRVQGPGCRV
jgi:DNA polymerase iota